MRYVQPSVTTCGGAVLGRLGQLCDTAPCEGVNAGLELMPGELLVRRAKNMGFIHHQCESTAARFLDLAEVVVLV